MSCTHTHLEQPTVVFEAIFSVHAGVIHLVPPAGQQQLTGAVEGGGVDGVTVDQANKVLPVMFPAQQHITESV